MMKAAILYNDKDIRPGNAPEPEIGPDEVLVRSGYAGICGTDLHVYRGEFKGRVTYPAILGHEFGGVIEAVGKAVRGYKVGDRVCVDPILSCHRCPACLDGHINACTTLKLLGIDLPGGFGQYVAVPTDRLVPLPEDIPMPYAPMVELYGIGHHILRRGAVQPGESVVILGAGKVGLSTLDVLCHSAGPALSIITDVHPARLAVAKKLGADVTIAIAEEDPVARVMDVTRGAGADVVIEAIGHYHEIPGQGAPLNQAVQMVRNGGRIVTVGLGEQLSPVHFKTLVFKEIALIGSRVTLGEFPRAIRLMAKGLLHPDLLVTHQMPMRDVAAAFAKVDAEEPETLKIVLSQDYGP
ncbi:MAG TPA: alcohol dehydrogenase catalytic domain-containing protein [Anaerolineae bacterium]|nr:alcohol dehydrogenase catalytic domain-containing protein [Anaerolineae bacterium]